MGTQRDHPSLLPLLKACLQRPIAFHRIFADIAGGIAPGLFLSQAWYWQQRTTDPEGWWYKTQVEWEEETALTRFEQENARMQLRRLRVLLEKRKGVPAKLFYKLNLEILQSRLLESSNLVCSKVAIKSAVKSQSIPEITSEILTEILTTPPVVPQGGHGAMNGTSGKLPRKPRKSGYPTTPAAQEALYASVFTPSLTTWVHTKGITLNLADQWELFVGKAIANGYIYLDWPQAFRNWLTSPYQTNGPPIKKTVQQKQEALRKWAEKEMQETRHGSQ